MKRHPELQALSREHHGALKLARDAKIAAGSADAAQVERLAARVVNCFAAELEPHFMIEEQELLPRLAQAAQGAEAPLVARTLAEHAALRALAERLRTPDANALAEFAELLAAHVRFEERELFEAVQACTTGDRQISHSDQVL
jgi:hemerythrin-like domain-containing protein